MDGVDRQHFEDFDTRGGPAHQLLDGVGVQHRSSAGPLEPVEKHVPGFREAKGGELLYGLGENGLATEVSRDAIDIDRPVPEVQP